MDSLSTENELTEEQIRDRADAQVRAYLGGKTVEIIGLMFPDGKWTESGYKSPCGVCDNGRSLEKIKPAICLKCLRADKKFDKVLQAAAKWEQRQFALQRVISERESSGTLKCSDLPATADGTRVPSPAGVR